MDILYQLPFPDEVCSKIFTFACKSPHTGLGVSILKKQFEKYDVDLLYIPDNDKDVISFNLDYYSRRPPIDIYLFTCFHNLTKMYLCEACVTGDIADLKSLPNLTVIDLGGTAVTGDIAHLKSLRNLTEIKLYKTAVTGNIVNLKSLLNLTVIALGKTAITGDIAHLKSLKNLTEIGFYKTAVTGDIAYLTSLPKLTDIYIYKTAVTGVKEAFHNYRKRVGLPQCKLYI